MSNITADEREFILTGISADEWDSLFPEEDEPEEGEDPAYLGDRF